MKFQEIGTTKVKRVQLVDRLGSEANLIGTIHITTSHFIFKAEDTPKEIWISNALIGSIERSSISAAGSRLIIKCKNFQTITLLIPKEKECLDLYETLLRVSKLYNINEAFAFFRKENPDKQVSVKEASNNWFRLNWDEEFKRQEVGDTWKKTDFNAAYAYCDTYPEELWIPANASTQVLIGSCRFRSRARLPVLTYYYKANGAAICRCSQPLAGFSARCVEDENLMELIMGANQSASTLYLIDTRPKVNAMVNKVQGKGFEDVRNYQNMQSHFFDIENIHVMRSSLNKLLDACQKSTSVTEYLKAVESSGWLRHLKILIECGKFISDSILRCISCVVHCSDGWDRTSQTVAIAQLLLDPYYRTIYGFQVLLDKDWLGFGFKFDDRCSHLSANEELLKEASPIFTQFIDVVYQLMRQKPTAFEFNERFLLEINEHAYSCMYGTFLGNCDKDRKDLRVATRTHSLWAHIDSNLEHYKNPFYKSTSYYLNDIDLGPSAFVVWTNLYNQFDTGIQPREYINDVAVNTKEHLNVLETKLKQVNEGKLLPTNFSVKWQSLLNAEECYSRNCGLEYTTRFEKRLYCYNCGKVFCKRCIKVNEHGSRLCAQCLKASS
uniref:Phosphatidylinositol-3-phosphatase n=1 Tax=Acrobeloides nanus TaxID=290746 RepID=A0A914BYE1_9BILA